MVSNFSIAEENYIKTIFHLQQNHASVATNDVAGALHTKAASVTDMLKKLKAKNIVEYERYKGVILSNNGEKVALSIVRKHRLWEYFLVEKLQFDWDEVHEVAEELEHISSKKLVEKLDAYLGFPRFDPHGDPIPDSEGVMRNQLQMLLLEAPLHTHLEITAVANQTTQLLELLKHRNMGMGTLIFIQQKFDFDDSLEIQLVASNQVFTISQQMASVLFVKLSTV
ncbi:MAG: metal-dependent transcriptional regulator [Chitinophagaceae bacterium]